MPLATGFGAVGHELMHDLDWQTARDYSRRRGAYATDNASRGARTQPIAAPLVRLAEFVPAGAIMSAFTTEARRPAELLARGADWFLASALARQGRMNGALSAVQDGWIRGYASAAGPAAFGDHAAALSALFDVMPALSVRASRRRPAATRNGSRIWEPSRERPGSRRCQRRTRWLPPQAMLFIPVAAGPACSPLARLRLAPMRTTARAVAAGFVEPRVARTMRRWARLTDTTGPASRTLRRSAAGLLGGPVNPRGRFCARGLGVRSVARAALSGHLIT